MPTEPPSEAALKAAEAIARATQDSLDVGAKRVMFEEYINEVARTIDSHLKPERDAARDEAAYLRVLLKEANENKLPRLEEVQLIYQLSDAHKALEDARDVAQLVHDKLWWRLSPNGEGIHKVEHKTVEELVAAADKALAAIGTALGKKEQKG